MSDEPTCLCGEPESRHVLRKGKCNRQGCSCQSFRASKKGNQKAVGGINANLSRADSSLKSLTSSGVIIITGGNLYYDRTQISEQQVRNLATAYVIGQGRAITIITSNSDTNVSNQSVPVELKFKVLRGPQWSNPKGSRTFEI